jgi:phosphoglycerol transferase MdoB-like AlkP superfamily enzyme
MEKKSSAASKSGLLRVHTWGGASWISEFAVLCGVDPTIFGLAGAQPHLNLSRYVKNCLPNYLKRLGYETHAIYTSYWNFVGVGAGFKRYGIDDFIDIRRIKGAPTDWRLQRDKFFIDEARRILAQPSRQPRFIFVSTNWNHSPHGQGSHLETYPGPFDIGKASDGSTRDYVNRLNDTFTEMAKLERDLTARGKPTVMLFYGDHHPAFVKKYAPDLPADPYVRTDVLTFYRFARSYGPAGASPHATLWIEELPTRFLEFADIPLPPAMATIRALREKCNNTDGRCPAPLKIGIGAAILED